MCIYTYLLHYCSTYCTSYLLHFLVFGSSRLEYQLVYFTSLHFRQDVPSSCTCHLLRLVTVAVLYLEDSFSFFPFSMAHAEREGCAHLPNSQGEEEGIVGNFGPQAEYSLKKLLWPKQYVGKPCVPAYHLSHLLLIFLCVNYQEITVFS